MSNTLKDECSTPTPWRAIGDIGDKGKLTFTIEHVSGNALIPIAAVAQMADATLIIHHVNTYDKLVRGLKESIEALKLCHRHLEGNQKDIATGVIRDLEEVMEIARGLNE